MSETRASNSKPQHEETDADIRSVSIFGITLFALMVLIFVLMIALFQYFHATHGTETTETLPVEEAPVLPPEPRLQVAPEIDLEKFRAQEDSILHSYGWVSKEAAVVRVPIERAMDLILERGLPSRPQGGDSQQ